MSQYVALLRGVNVGGKNVIKMTDLKACFEEHGFRRIGSVADAESRLRESQIDGRAGAS